MGSSKRPIGISGLIFRSAVSAVIASGFIAALAIPASAAGVPASFPASFTASQPGVPTIGPAGTGTLTVQAQNTGATALDASQGVVNFTVTAPDNSTFPADVCTSLTYAYSDGPSSGTGLAGQCTYVSPSEVDFYLNPLSAPNDTISVGLAVTVDAAAPAGATLTGGALTLSGGTQNGNTLALTPATPSAALVINTTAAAPATLAITGPADGAIVGQLPAVSGSGQPGATVTITDQAGVPVCTATVGNDGAFSCTPTSPFPAGANSLTPVQTNLDGSTTTGTPIDVTVAATPVIIRPTNLDTLKLLARVSGTGQPGAPVNIIGSFGNTVCTTTVKANGWYSCTPENPLPVGVNTLTPVQTNPDGTTTTGAPVRFTVWPASSNYPVISGPAEGSVVGSLPTITGTGTPGTSVTITDKDYNPVCTATVGVDGRYSCTLTQPLPAGPNILSPVQMNADGGMTTGAPVDITVKLPRVPTKPTTPGGTGQKGGSTVGPPAPTNGTGTAARVVPAPVTIAAEVGNGGGSGVSGATLANDGAGTGTANVAGSADPSLAYTGANFAAPLGIGGALLMLGGLIVLFQRRRGNRITG